MGINAKGGSFEHVSTLFVPWRVFCCLSSRALAAADGARVWEERYIPLHFAAGFPFCINRWRASVDVACSCAFACFPGAGS